MTPCLCHPKQCGGQFLTLRTGTSAAISLSAWSVVSRLTIMACSPAKHGAAGSPQSIHTMSSLPPWPEFIMESFAPILIA